MPHLDQSIGNCFLYLKRNIILQLHQDRSLSWPASYWLAKFNFMNNSTKSLSTCNLALRHTWQLSNSTACCTASPAHCSATPAHCPVFSLSRYSCSLSSLFFVQILLLTVRSFLCPDTPAHCPVFSLSRDSCSLSSLFFVQLLLLTVQSFLHSVPILLLAVQPLLLTV
jgi:hypothetical protein